MTRSLFAALTLAALFFGAAGIDRWVNPSEEQIAAGALRNLIPR